MEEKKQRVEKTSYTHTTLCNNVLPKLTFQNNRSFGDLGRLALQSWAEKALFSSRVSAFWPFGLFQKMLFYWTYFWYLIDFLKSLWNLLVSQGPSSEKGGLLAGVPAFRKRWSGQLSSHYCQMFKAAFAHKISQSPTAKEMSWISCLKKLRALEETHPASLH